MSVAISAFKGSFFLSGGEGQGEKNAVHVVCVCVCVCCMISTFRIVSSGN